MIEDLHTEFKREWKNDYLRNVAALANTDGGVIHIGIDDDGTVYGVTDLNRSLKQIPDDIQNVLGIVPVVDHYVNDGKNCISITVKKSADPIFYDGKILIKSGSTTRVLAGPELTEKLLKGVKVQWIDISVDNVTVDRLSEEAILYFLKSSKKIPMNIDSLADIEVNNVLLNLGLIDSNMNLTRAAIILFHPEPSKYITDAYLKIGEFDIKGELLREQYVKCPIILMPDKVSEIIFENYVPGHFNYNQMQRKIVYKYPVEAVREILINAIIHNDYSIGWPIEVRVYSNKMIIFNYGELPVGWGIDTLLGAHPSVPRNRRLAEVFHEAGLIEKWGKGIGMVIDACKEAELPEPTFDIYFKGIRVTFNGNINKYEQTGTVITKKQIEILRAIQNGCNTREQISIALSMSDSTVKRNISVLVKNGYLRREGSNKKGKWIILKNDPICNYSGINVT